MLQSFNYLIYVLLMMIGLYAAIAKQNVIKKMIGLSLFQTGIFIFYISLGVVDRGVAPIGVDAPTRFHAAFEHLAEHEGEAEHPALERAEAAVEAVFHPPHDAGHGDGHHVDPEDPETLKHALEAAGEALAPEQLAQLEELVRRDRLIVDGEVRPYTNPLPHVLILTAIVVSVSTLAVALAIIVWIRREFGTLEDDELAELELEHAATPEGAA